MSRTPFQFAPPANSAVRALPTLFEGATVKRRLRIWRERTRRYDERTRRYDECQAEQFLRRGAEQFPLAMGALANADPGLAEDTAPVVVDLIDAASAKVAVRRAYAVG